MCAYGFFTGTQLHFYIVCSSIPVPHDLLTIIFILTINTSINILLLQLCHKESQPNMSGCGLNVQDLNKFAPGRFTRNVFLWIEYHKEIQSNQLAHALIIFKFSPVKSLQKLLQAAFLVCLGTSKEKSKQERVNNLLSTCAGFYTHWKFHSSRVQVTLSRNSSCRILRHSLQFN